MVCMTIDAAGNIHRGAGLNGAGQFSGRVPHAPAGDLVEETVPVRWGEVNLREGSRTPWGPAQSVDRVADGIVAVGTAGHGGVKLSPERNRVIPPALRDQTGWYEEDMEVNIVRRYFSDEWAGAHWVHDDAATIREDADASIRHWLPDGWEAANGRVLAPGESRVKDEAAWLARHAGEPVVISASRAESDADLLRVSANVDGARHEYLVPREEYETRSAGTELGQNGRFVVDPSRHPRLPSADPARPAAPTVVKVTVPSALERQADRALTAVAKDRISRDLHKRWRHTDDSGATVVRSLEEIISTDGLEGKGAFLQGGKMVYSLHQPTPEGRGHYGFPVSKALFDYLTTVPDVRSPSQIAQQRAYAYQERVDRKWPGPTPEESARARSLYAEYRKLADAEEAERTAREGSWAERDAARRLTIAERERAATVS